jgi:FkbM family methyltransferase
MDAVIQAVRDWRATGSLRDALELARLARLPRRQAARARVLGMELALVDGASFVFMCREIFGRQIYRFAAQRLDPVIIDAGANIGLSVLYFKRLYPRSAVSAYEADPGIFRVLADNVRGLEGVTLSQRAVWTHEASITFHPEGADGGRAHPVTGTEAVQVPSVRLRDHIGERVDLLKVDIEGAEVDVLADCASELTRVERIFVEYHSFVGESQRLAELLLVLRDAGFRVWIEAPLRIERPLLQRPEYLGMDLQLNIFATRV